MKLKLIDIWDHIANYPILVIYTEHNEVSLNLCDLDEISMEAYTKEKNILTLFGNCEVMEISTLNDRLYVSISVTII